MLCSLGTVVVGSVASQLLISQILFYFVGIVLFFIFSKIDYHIYIHLWKQIFVVAIFLLVLTILLGLESRGATRWISIGGFRLQFSEILKPFVISSLVAFVTERKKYFIAALLGLIPIVLVFKQPDLGSALIYVAGVSVAIFLSDINISYIISTVVGVISLLPISWHFLAEYQKNRIISFLNPSSDPLGTSYNAIQATIAVGSGMLFGLGLGRGTQSQLLFLPEHHTDFIFATLSEELGFFGASLLIIIFFILMWRILKVSGGSIDKYGMVLGCSLGVMILAQVFINIGMNLSILPVTGITLPLISYGGSSILATMITLGIIENIASQRFSV